LPWRLGTWSGKPWNLFLAPGKLLPEPWIRGTCSCHRDFKNAHGVLLLELRNLPLALGNLLQEPQKLLAELLWALGILFLQLRNQVLVPRSCSCLVDVPEALVAALGASELLESRNLLLGQCPAT